MNILEELYYGNIRPDSRVYPPNSPFVEAAHLKSIAKRKLILKALHAMILLLMH